MVLLCLWLLWCWWVQCVLFLVCSFVQTYVVHNTHQVFIPSHSTAPYPSLIPATSKHVYLHKTMIWSDVRSLRLVMFTIPIKYSYPHTLTVCSTIPYAMHCASIWSLISPTITLKWRVSQVCAGTQDALVFALFSWCFFASALNCRRPVWWGMSFRFE